MHAGMCARARCAAAANEARDSVRCCFPTLLARACCDTLLSLSGGHVFHDCYRSSRMHKGHLDLMHTQDGDAVRRLVGEPVGDHSVLLPVPFEVPETLHAKMFNLQLYIAHSETVPSQ